MDISSSVNEQVMGSCESGNGPSISIQCGEIFWIAADTLAYERGFSSSAARLLQGEFDIQRTVHHDIFL